MEKPTGTSGNVLPGRLRRRLRQRRSQHKVRVDYGSINSEALMYKWTNRLSERAGAVLVALPIALALGFGAGQAWVKYQAAHCMTDEECEAVFGALDE
jgi:hypothetical protein